MPLFLVEEHGSSPYGGEEEIKFSVVVRCRTPQTAFKVADRYSKRTRTVNWPDMAGGPESQAFLFSVEELVEVHKGYLWVANDGSSVWYEVRKLPKPL